MPQARETLLQEEEPAGVPKGCRPGAGAGALTNPLTVSLGTRPVFLFSGSILKDMPARLYFAQEQSLKKGGENRNGIFT